MKEGRGGGKEREAPTHLIEISKFPMLHALLKIIGASRSEPHTSESIEIFSICMYVCAVRPTVYILLLILRLSKLSSTCACACMLSPSRREVCRVVQTLQSSCSSNFSNRIKVVSGLEKISDGIKLFIRFYKATQSA